MSRLESDYYSFMGFDGAHSAEGLAHYTPFFTETEVAGPVLDLACGRGEFLELLGKAGVDAVGVDLDEGMVDAAREAGRPAEHGDALADLAGRKPDSLRGVFSAHFVEHLEPAQVGALTESAATALAPGGRLVLVTPNAACQAVMAYDFWRDPTHVRFYDASLLAFFCERAGLTVLSTGGNPQNAPGAPPETVPAPATIDPALDDEIAKLVQFATDPTGAGTRDPNSAWPAFGHLLVTMARRLRHTQEQLVDLHLAHRQLLERLWPPNEVYVVAEKPGPLMSGTAAT